MEFTYDAYKNLVKDVLKSGYEITDYHSYKSCERPCILRHDVDMDVKKAALFAEMEAEISATTDVHATYFVLLTSDFYNLYSKKNIVLIKKIMSHGHEIGLHFDEKRYMDDNTFDASLLKEAVEKECNILSNLIEKKVKVVSMHRPSQKFLQSNFKFEGIINSYSAELFNNFKYLSDSRMCWREDVNDIVNKHQEKALHILTHPFWYAKESYSTHDILERFLERAYYERYDMISDNFRNLEEVIKPK